ncbi:MAG: RNA 3'-terminal phosphate cyclase [Pseudomonadota bacterium]
MIDLDASFGEGGGQILRSALSLSLITGSPVRLSNVRASRPKPGLQPQHLKALHAAAVVGRAQITGAELGSRQVTFSPNALEAGDYAFDIGTAGATSLVLQTLFVPLAFAGGPSHVTLGGGTHVPWSPCFHYLEWQWLPWLRAAGFRGELALTRPGFYPRGGGSVGAWIEPAGALKALHLVERGRLIRIRGLAGVGSLPAAIAQREQVRVQERLAALGVPIDVRTCELESVSRGNFVILAAEFDNGRLCYGSLGALGKPAETVADEALQALLDGLASGGAIDEHLADQLLLPLCFAPGTSELAPCRITQHLLTNAHVLRCFLPVSVEVEGALGQPGTVHISGRAGIGRAHRDTPGRSPSPA